METSLVKPEIVWMEEECHEIMLPLKQEDCKQEDIADSIDYVQSSEEGIGENIFTSEELQFATVKCEKESEDDVHETADLDVKEEDVIIIEDENPLTSSSEEAKRLPPSAPETQSEEIVPQTFYKRIGETYYCIPCDTPFHRQSDFDSHAKICQKQFKCPKCDKSFRFRSKFLQHALIHSEVKSFSCTVCDRQFKRNSDMQKHMFNHGKSISILKNNQNASISSEPVGEPDLLSSGQQSEITANKDKHFCCQCSAVFSSKGELTMHVSNAHGHHPKGSYKCPKCLKSFLSSAKLMEHMKFHSCSWKNDCNICKKSFSDRTKLYKHMQEHSSGDALISAKMIGNQRSLKRDYTCRICDKIFPWPSQLKEHMTTHTKETVYTCDICKKSFGWKSGLIYHMAQHTGDFGYSCRVCKTKFSRNAEVVEHMQNHCAEKPYSCAMCRVSFTCLSHLAKHVSVHSANQPSNSCIVCHKTFGHVSSLRYHMRLSLHGMLFACSLCGKPFFNAFALKSHLRLIHRWTRSKSELGGNAQDGLSKEVTATSNGSQDKSLDMGEVESNSGRGPSDIHQSPSLAASQIRGIDTLAIQKRIETRNGLDSVIIEVSYPNSGKEGEKSFSGEGQITKKGKEHSSSSQCNRSLLITAGEKKPAELHTTAKNCEDGNSSRTEKIIGNGGKIKDYTRLKRNMVSNSTQERPELFCKKCGVFFSNVQSYKRHNISYHNDQTFPCNVCGIVFLEQSVLDSHMIGHTADRPFSCFICKDSFRRIRTLRLHLKCHEGKAKFPCEVCDEIFDSISALKQHLISHAGKEVQS